MPTPRLSFIVLNLNGGPLLREALQSIERQTFTDYEVLVVDNGSHDRSWDLPCFARPGWYLLRLETNRGFSEGNNIAFARATGAVIALVNNDVVLDSNWAARVMDAFADPQVAFAACRLVQRRHPERLDSAGFDLYACITTKVWMGKPAERFTDRDHDPFGPVAAAAAYRRSALEETGLFHPEYFAYYEDTDLSMRLVLFGHRGRYVDAARAQHWGSGTGKALSDFQRYHLRRNVEFVYWVDMVGYLALKHAFGHVVYETLAGLGMLFKGQGRVFLLAKLDALRMAGWIFRERRALRRRLADRVGLRAAQRRLESRLRPFWEVLCREENRTKW